MRIAFVVCGPLASVSGGFLYDRRLIAELRARGAVVDVIELPWWPYERALALNLWPWSFSGRGYDAVIQDELCHPAVLLRNRWLGGRVFSLVHNLASDQPGTRRPALVRACERGYFRSVAGVIAVCADTLAGVRRCGGATLPAVVARPGRDHVTVIDAAMIERREVGGPVRLAFVGQVAAHKGLHRLLPVLARVPNVSVEVAGGTADSGYVGRLQADIARAGLAGRVHLHGLLGPQALADLLSRCHAFVMPSDREAYPLGALEAMAAGLPVLLTSAGGTAELLGDSDAGRLLAPDDTFAWIKAVGQLEQDRPRLRRMSHAARARYLAHGTWADTARAVLDFVGPPAA
jgi:glycosyltransferase involved in cell wall biosynthesis